MSETGSAKRPSKSMRLAFLDSQFAVYQAQIPGFTIETVKAMVAVGNHYLSQPEVDELVEKRKNDKNFDLAGFLQFLQEADAIKAAPEKVQSNIKAIDSMERALEITNEGEDAELVQSLTKKLIEIRNQINPLISKHAVMSLAFKNIKAEETGKEETVNEPVVDPAGN